MNNISDIEKLLQSLQKDSAAVPSDTFRTNARIRIINTVTNPHPLHASWYQRPRVFGYTFGSALATVVLSVGTVYAAQLSPPNSALFPVKVLSEKVALTLSPTESMKTSVAQTIISRRITEVEEFQKHGSADDVEESISRLQSDVSSIQKRKDVRRSEIELTLTEHKKLFDEINKDRGENNGTDGQEESITPTLMPQDNGSQEDTSTQIRLPEVKGIHSNKSGDSQDD